MKLGFNLLLWTGFVDDAQRATIEALKAAGYDGIEVPLFSGTVAHYQDLGTFSKGLGLGSTAVTVLPEGASCIDESPAVRTAALDHIKWAIDCAAALNASLLAGPFHQPLGVFSGQGPTAAEFDRCVGVHQEAARYAAAAGVSLSVEPLNRFECYFLNTADQASALVKAVNAPGYGYLYDTFHFNIEENDLADAAARTIGAINHVHISENTRGAPGDGHIGFSKVIGQLVASGYDGWLTVEAFGSALPDLAAATRIWRPLFETPEDVYQTALTTMKDALMATR
ncbi:MAG: sugar phosphate isomerase/epimerase [Pseudomonadota bacterium]